MSSIPQYKNILHAIQEGVTGVAENFDKVGANKNCDCLHLISVQESDAYGLSVVSKYNKARMTRQQQQVENAQQNEVGVVMQK